jgi:hypothetical protein
MAEIITTDKTAARQTYPEIFEQTTPNNPQEAEKIFKDFEEALPDYLDKDDLWCDIFQTSKGKIAVLSDCDINSDALLYIIELER